MIPSEQGRSCRFDPKVRYLVSLVKLCRWSMSRLTDWGSHLSRTTSELRRLSTKSLRLASMIYLVTSVYVLLFPVRQY